ncbi:glyoxalase superfamily protein [Oceanicella sp. SM1341]|uniref:glyoxalase superfamily protein n=1 Tax=Oceanicella sp. SM1341 TaxID=1548889 RepID=UPI0018E4E781|nr:glyoxalase superfamily protein [Oceanicella sp. SM1341]
MHAQALELLARPHGARDWNTLHARLADARTGGAESAAQAVAPGPFRLDQRVRGLYLGQPFCGEIVALAATGESAFRLELALDSPVDTVRCARFPNLRRRIRATVGADGRSPRRTGDGAPQLILERARAGGRCPP